MAIDMKQDLFQSAIDEREKARSVTPHDIDASTCTEEAGSDNVPLQLHPVANSTIACKRYSFPDDGDALLMKLQVKYSRNGRTNWVALAEEFNEQQQTDLKLEYLHKRYYRKRAGSQ